MHPVLGVVDARGSGAGWNLQISATNFSDGAGHTLAPGTVTAAAQACHAGSSCTAATNSGITLPLTITGTAAKFFNAAVNTGLGKVDVTPTIQVAIPGNSFAGHLHLDGHARSCDRPLSLPSATTAASSAPADQPGHFSVQDGIERTILPSCSPASRRSCAARASASGNTRSTTGRARPAATRS